MEPWKEHLDQETRKATSIARIHSATQADVKYLSLQFRCRGGSLPLKKRRFSVISETDSSSHSIASVPGDNCSVREGKLATLSLIASSVPLAQVDTVGDASEDLSTDPEEKSESSASSRPFEGAALDLPRDGCCHGRTARNNSYCKRQPCYMGSRFCKLHYQQCALSETSLKLRDEDSLTTKQPSPVPMPSIGEKKQGSFQDKRFTGSAGEIRCKATTTRGRECAYIAVSGCKYCYLHADYDNNPPPKRGGGSSSKRVTESSSSRTKAGVELPHKVPIPSESSKAVTSKDAGKPKTSSERSKRRGSTSKIARKHMDSRFPLLSMISTDQWAKKRVKISVGPLSDRVGTVEKWSNGWVTVHVDGVGTHNRRSFELLLLEDMKDGPEETKPSVLGDISRLTPSPITTETPSTVKPIIQDLKSASQIPVTPYTGGDEAIWPITPAPSTDAPFVPHVTPNSPRRPMCTTTDKTGVCSMGEGIFLADSGGQAGISLHLRVGALEQRLGSATSFSAASRGSAAEKNIV